MTPFASERKPLEPPAAALGGLVLAAIVVTVVLWSFADTAWGMVSIWARSETFMHGALVPGLSLWLMWRSRKRVATVPMGVSPWLLPLVAVACLAWLLGELASVKAVSQLALVTVLVVSVPVMFGWPVARAWLFPLAFLYFSVPVGEFAVPWLMMRTADATALALSWVGIPVYREGLELIIPSGHWSVVEACSGLRYLVASFMVGTLYAYLTYTRLYKRIAFIAASLAVPIIANWARAFLIVLLGHVSGNELATGVDHVIYGWAFFGLIIGLMFWIGLRWSDDPSEHEVQTRPVQEVGTTPGASWFQPARLVATIALVGLVVGSQVMWRHMQQAPSVTLPALTLPEGAGGWTVASGSSMPWVPGYRDPTSVASVAYERGGYPVWMWVGYYRQPGGHGKLVSSSNAVEPVDEKSWAVYERESKRASDKVPTVRAMSLRRGTAIGNDTVSRFRVWELLWVDGRWTASPVLAKILQAKGQLLGRSGDGAVVMVATPLHDQAEAQLLQLLELHLGAVAARLETLRAASSSNKAQP